MQKFVTLSTTEAECVATTECVQDMLFGKRFLEAMELKVKLPMTLYMDNRGGVDVLNSWSIAGNTRAISVRLAYLRELKEAGTLEIKWIHVLFRFEAVADISPQGPSVISCVYWDRFLYTLRRGDPRRR
jgi:hypothetical protein